MKAEAFRELKTPPPELAARVMGDVRAWRQPPSITWLVSGQTAVLAALLFVSAPTLPDQMAATTETVRDWSASLATEVVKMSDRFGELVGISELEKIL